MSPGRAIFELEALEPRILLSGDGVAASGTEVEASSGNLPVEVRDAVGIFDPLRTAEVPDIFDIEKRPLTVSAESETEHDLALRLIAGDQPVLEISDHGQVISSQLLSKTSAVQIAGGDQGDQLHINDSVPGSLPVYFDGGGGNDTLHGRPSDIAWQISGANAGKVGLVEFVRVENLKGAESNRDTFTVLSEGRLDGTIDGSDGGFDSLRPCGSMTAPSN